MMAENLTSFRMFLANCTGNAQNTTYKTPVNINNVEDLAAACRKDHVCTEFKENRRGSDTFIRCYAIQGDCDNDNTDDPAAWITPADVAARIPGIAFYAVKSRNCDKVKHKGKPGEQSARPRWHYYFPLCVPIPDIGIIRQIMARILVVFPEFDKAGMKPAQFFYGHAGPVAEYHPGTKDIAQFFIAHPEIAIPAQTPAVDLQPAIPQKPAAGSGSDEENLLLANLPDMLKFFDAQDYGYWVFVGICLKPAGNQYYDYWDKWSQTSSKYPGSAESWRKWDRDLKADGKTGPGSLFYEAKERGWKQQYFTGEFKEAHEAAEKRKATNSNPVDWDDMITTDVPAPDPEQPIPGKTVITTPGATEPEKKKPLVISGYDDVEIKETDYLFFPWFPRGKLVTIQGDSGSSKSTFFYGIGALVTNGADLLNVPCEDPGNVMFITNEDDPGDILTAFLDAGGDPSRLLRINDREQIAMLDLSPAGAKKIDEIIKGYDIKLLVLDPIQAFLCGDMNKANETRPQLARLANIAAENNNCIAFIQHMGKDSTKGALFRGLGSVDIGAATRSILQIVTDPEDDLYKIAFTVKNNTAALQDVRKAIRYQVKDHPGSFDHSTRKHHHFHGHAEFIKLLPEYTEKTYKRAQQNAERSAVQEGIDYSTDPLVLTVCKLIEYNPEGMYIGAGELIRRITICQGWCPYEQTQDKAKGLNSRISVIRNHMMSVNAIQMDLETVPKQTKPYRWDGEIVVPDKRERGVYLTPIKNGSVGFQQTEM